MMAFNLRVVVVILACISCCPMPVVNGRILYGIAAARALDHSEGAEASMRIWSSLGMALRRLLGDSPVNKAQIERIWANQQEGVVPEQPTDDIRDELIKHACAQKGDIPLPDFGC